jgi:hypothetical protein
MAPTWLDAAGCRLRRWPGWNSWPPMRSGLHPEDEKNPNRIVEHRVTEFRQQCLADCRMTLRRGYDAVSSPADVSGQIRMGMRLAPTQALAPFHRPKGGGASRVDMAFRHSRDWRGSDVGCLHRESEGGLPMVMISHCVKVGAVAVLAAGAVASCAPFSSSPQPVQSNRQHHDQSRRQQGRAL